MRPNKNSFIIKSNWNNYKSINKSFESMTLYVALVLHIYQPPIQTPAILKQISEESYHPLIDLHLQMQSAKITLNINGSLLELMEFYQDEKFLSGLKELVQRKQFDLLGSSCYHAILPLIPKEEILRQISLNEELHSKVFGDIFRKPSGFWLPEMAYEFRVVEPLVEKGYSWTVLSSVACSNGELPDNFIPKVKANFTTYFRNDLLSNLISFSQPTVDEFYKELKGDKNPKEEDYYVILAMDGETYGHHVKGLIENFLEPLYKKIDADPNVQLVTIKELPDYFAEKRTISPLPSSWSTSAEDLEKGVPFPLWADPSNRIHDLQKTIMNHALFLVGLAQKNYNKTETPTEEVQNRFQNARKWLDQGLHSCQLWWASGKPWYSSEMILKGLNQLILSASEALKVILWNGKTSQDKDIALRIFDEIFEAQKEMFLIV